MSHRRPPAVVAAALTAALALGLSVVGTGTASAEPPPHTSPAFAGDFPDPFVLPVPGGYLAFGTSGPLGRVQVIRSADLSSWVPVGDALSDAPAWAEVGTGAVDGVWAPAVLATEGGWSLFTSVVHAGTGKRCLARAVATAPEGPYEDDGQPYLCDDARNGAIDPSVTRDERGAAYLLWKTEGVPGREPPRIWASALDAAGRRTGPAARLVQADQPWEFPLVENPAMVRDPASGRWFLFFSGSLWDTASYAVGWAVCSSPLGPCAKPPNRRLIASEGSTHRGPGAAEVVAGADGRLWLAYHAWGGRVGYGDGGRRTLRLRRLGFPDGRPGVGDAAGNIVAPPFAERVAGSDRFTTAAAYAAATVPPFAPVTYVATGAAFADALAGGAAAGVEDSPVLLVRRDAVPPSTAAELERLRPGHIVVLGGEAAVAEPVAAELGRYAGGSMHREPGNDRFDTAARVSANTFRNGAPVAYVATGESFPDALAAGAAGAAMRGPVLLVTRDAVPGSTAAELRRLRPGAIVVVGGTAAVSAGVEEAMRAYTPGPVTRVAGVDRYDTAARLARTFPAPVGAVVVATGVSFADAVVAGAAGFPVLLVPPDGSLPAAVEDSVRALAPQGALVAGGAAAVPDATIRALNR